MKNTAITFIVFVVITGTLKAQNLSATINQSSLYATSCNRTLSANVQGGSGQYIYQWSVSTPGLTFPGPDNSQTITVALNQTTDFILFVQDQLTGNAARTSTTVPRILMDDFYIFFPNIITPNGDGYNDIWKVMDAGKAVGPINAYSYDLKITDSRNNLVLHTYETAYADCNGIYGGQIKWNGTNSSGSTVPVGMYQYTLMLQNCTQSLTYSGTIFLYL